MNVKLLTCEGSHCTCILETRVLNGMSTHVNKSRLHILRQKLSQVPFTSKRKRNKDVEVISFFFMLTYGKEFSQLQRNWQSLYNWFSISQGAFIFHVSNGNRQGPQPWIRLIKALLSLLFTYCWLPLSCGRVAEKNSNRAIWANDKCH